MNHIFRDGLPVGCQGIISIATKGQYSRHGGDEGRTWAKEFVVRLTPTHSQRLTSGTQNRPRSKSRMQKYDLELEIVFSIVTGRV